MKAIILDRDGVINQDSPDYIKSVDEWIPIDGSIKAIASLSKSGYRVFVATNQSGLGRKYFDEFTLANIHQKLCNLVEEEGGIIDGIFYCPHVPSDNCDCRKPGVGLLENIQEEFDCSLRAVPFVGDSMRDIEAAIAFGCHPILVRTGNGKITESSLKHKELHSVTVFDNLAEVSQSLINLSNAS